MRETADPVPGPAHLASQVLGVPLLTPIQLMNQNRTVSGANPCRRLAIEATLNLDPPLATW